MVGNTNVTLLGQFWNWSTIKSGIDQPAQIPACETPYPKTEHECYKTFNYPLALY